MSMKSEKSEKQRRDSFSKNVLNQMIVGITIEDGTLAFLLDNGKSVLIWDDQGDLQAWAGNAESIQ